MLLIRGFDSVASSLSTLTANLENALQVPFLDRPLLYFRFSEFFLLLIVTLYNFGMKFTCL